MKKTNAAYKMSKSSKIHLATTWNRPHQAERRKALIQAELFGAEVQRPRKDKNSTDTRI